MAMYRGHKALPYTRREALCHSQDFHTYATATIILILAELVF